MLPPMQVQRLPPGPPEHGGSPGEIELAFYDVGQGPALVLCHGFPEVAFSWRHQIVALAEAGYRVIAPDQRGFGASQAPAEIEAYGLDCLTGDLVALLDLLEIERAVFVGHDWGGFVTWAMPVLHASRTAGVIGVNTPYRAFPTTSRLRTLVNHDDDIYLLWFQTPGIAERVLDAHRRAVFEKLMRRPPARSSAAPPTQIGARPMNPFLRIAEMEPRGEPLLDADEIEAYARAFEKNGFRGGINWYRNVDRNAERFPGVGTQTLDVPCLMICGERDPVLPPALAAGMEERIPDLETHVLPDCGHWTQQERPAEFNRCVLTWLRAQGL